MPIWDSLASGATHQIGAIWDFNGSMSSPIGNVWDFNGSVYSHIYTSSVTVTLTNYGKAAEGVTVWSDIGATGAEKSLCGGSPPSGRFWVYARYGGWAYDGGGGQAVCWVRTGTGDIGGNVNLFAGGPSSPTVATMSVITNLPSGSYSQWSACCLYRSNSTQGYAGTYAQSMVVPLAPLENALGRQVSAAEVASWFGVGWTGSKTVTIQI